MEDHVVPRWFIGHGAPGEVQHGLVTRVETSPSEYCRAKATDKPLPVGHAERPIFWVCAQDVDICSECQPVRRPVGLRPCGREVGRAIQRRQAARLVWGMALSREARSLAGQVESPLAEHRVQGLPDCFADRPRRLIPQQGQSAARPQH